LWPGFFQEVGFVKTVIVVNNPAEWPFNFDNIEVVSARTYIGEGEYCQVKDLRVFNLCKSYRYQSIGYYVSLLAAARGHKPMPDVTAIQDMKSPTLVRFASEDLDNLFQKAFQPLQSEKFVLSIYFGRNLAKRYDQISQQLFQLFPSPFLQARFHKVGNDWNLSSISPISADQVPEAHRDFLVSSAQEYFSRSHKRTRRKSARYDLAILVNKQEKLPPSDKKALQRFEKAAESVGFAVEFIGREDYNRLAEFDALFIRETTAVNHHTYRFARSAEAQGMVVIDDPLSILRCTNKVYLAELMQKHKIPTPKTLVIHKGNYLKIADELEFPCVLKQPDSSFSQGVVKVAEKADLKKAVESLLTKSDLLIAQEFVPTDFDWRVGVLDGQPLYVCRYYMVGKHWQIYKPDGKGGQQCGRFDTIPVEHAPTRLIKMALKATRLIGDGLYGVDIKQFGNQFFLIEINDNPSIDSGVEDQVMKEELYLRIMRSFLRRVQKKQSGFFV
jgi:glutathione synthase/RimK-type ligase-like ATP-grasp enzyme